MRKDLIESDLNIIIDSLKTKSDFDETLDIKKFAQKLNMKISDKAELVNLLSKADWEKKI